MNTRTYLIKNDGHGPRYLMKIWVDIVIMYISTNKPHQGLNVSYVDVSGTAQQSSYGSIGETTTIVEKGSVVGRMV